MNNNTGPGHRPSECTSAPCADNRCVNGIYRVAQVAAAQLLWATQVTTAERAAVGYGHDPSHPVESIDRIRDDLEFILGLLADAPADGLRYFIQALKGLLPSVLRLPIDPTNPPEYLSVKAANFVRP
ncbi:MAG: hypothetical protein NVS3B1_11470 [Marmoricola sp.]